MEAQGDCGNKTKLVKKCEICGKEFRPVKTSGKYCSKECAKEANRIKNIELHKARMRENKGKQKKIEKKPTTIAEVQRAARAEGLTYGQYMAKQYKESGRL